MYYAQFINNRSGVPGRPVNTPFFYPVPDGTTCDEAQLLFASDPDRESKLLSSLPSLASNETYVLVPCNPTSSTPPSTTPPSSTPPISVPPDGAWHQSDYEFYS